MKKNTSLTIGFAIFAMLFGAGNIIFPLYLGVHSENHVIIAILGFLITGVGAPLLGLFSTSLFQGNYWKFFNRLGKTPAFITILFLMIIIGPFIAIPRTELIVWNNLLPYLPKILQSNYIFSFIYCIILLILNLKTKKIINMLGYVFSPIKIITLFSLIIIGLFFIKIENHDTINTINKLDILNKSILIGYSTMDLLATFFFTTLTFNAINQDNYNKQEKTILIIKANIIGAILISITYTGFILLANKYKSFLYTTPIENILVSISYLILGKLGGFFICMCLTFACIATAISLTQISTLYLYKEILKKKISKLKSLYIIIIITFTMSHLNFHKLMLLALPILKIFYPALIILCIMNILYKTTNITYIHTPIIITIIFTIIYIYK